MGGQIASMIAQAFSFAGDAWTRLLNATGMSGWWFAGVFTWLSYKFFLRPIFGHAGSDLAKRSYNAFRKSGKDDNS